MRGTVAAIAFSLSCSAALAQNATPLAVARQNFDGCFYRSVGAQIKQTAAAEVDLVSERAFLACATEEPGGPGPIERLRHQPLCRRQPGQHKAVPEGPRSRYGGRRAEVTYFSY